MASGLAQEEGARRSKYSEEDVRVARERFKHHQAVFKLQLSLVEPCSAGHLVQCAKRFQAFHLDEVAEERGGLGRCGYPLCAAKAMRAVPRNRVVDLKRGRILSAEEVGRFCSIECFDRLEVLKAQLPLPKTPDAELRVPLVDAGGKSATASVHSGASGGEAEDELPRRVDPVRVTEHAAPGPGSSNFPAPGSKASTFLVEGYRQAPAGEAGGPSTDELAAKVAAAKEAKARAKEAKASEQAAVAAQLTEQLRELGIDEAIEPGAVPVQHAAAPPADGNADDHDHGESEEYVGQEEGEEGEGDDELDAALDDLEEQDQLNFLDFSDLKADLGSFELTLLMRITSAVGEWKEPRPSGTEAGEEGLVDAAQASRFQVLTSSLSRAARVVAQQVDFPRLTHGLAARELADLARTFNYARPVPSFSPAEWQTLAAVLLAATFLRQANGLATPGALASDELKAATEALRAFCLSERKARLASDEFDSLSKLLCTSL